MAPLPPRPALLALLLPLLGSRSAASAASAEEPWYERSASGGGSQGAAERLMAAHLRDGAPRHPRRHERPNILPPSQAGAAHFTVDPSAPTTPFSHFFETSVGSGHMALTLREDWRGHVAMAARELGVKHIRGHGLLDDDMSVSYSATLQAFYNVVRSPPPPLPAATLRLV